MPSTAGSQRRRSTYNWLLAGANPMESDAMLGHRPHEITGAGDSQQPHPLHHEHAVDSTGGHVSGGLVQGGVGREGEEPARHDVSDQMVAEQVPFGTRQIDAGAIPGVAEEGGD